MFELAGKVMVLYIYAPPLLVLLPENGAPIRHNKRNNSGLSGVPLNPEEQRVAPQEELKQEEMFFLFFENLEQFLLHCRGNPRRASYISYNTFCPHLLLFMPLFFIALVFEAPPPPSPSLSLSIGCR